MVTLASTASEGRGKQVGEGGAQCTAGGQGGRGVGNTTAAGPKWAG
jgi:hypothetical protein